MELGYVYSMERITFDSLRKEFPEVSLDYLKLVLSAYENNKSFIIKNSTESHAKLLTYLLLNRSKESVKLFVEKIKNTFYEDDLIVNTLKNLNKEIKIKVILEKDSSGKIRELTNVEMFIATDDMIKKLHGVEINNFLVVDGCAFRYEENHSSPKESVSASVSFNDKHMSSSLDNLFQII